MSIAYSSVQAKSEALDCTELRARKELLGDNVHVCSYRPGLSRAVAIFIDLEEQATMVSSETAKAQGQDNMYIL